MPLLQPQTMPMQGGMPPEEEMPPEAGMEKEATEQAKATPADQDAYKRVVVAGMTLLNTKAIHGKIFKLLETGKGSPAKVLGNATLQLMAILKEKSPRDIPEQVVGSAAIEIMMMLAEEADAAGIFTVDERTLRQAGEVLIRGLASMYGVSQEEMDDVASRGTQAGTEPPAEPPQEGMMPGGQPGMMPQQPNQGGM